MFAQFELVAHPLDSQRLLFQGCGEGLNFLLLLCGGMIVVTTGADRWGDQQKAKLELLAKCRSVPR